MSAESWVAAVRARRETSEARATAYADHGTPEAAALDPVVRHLNAHYRPEEAASLLAAAQPLMAIAWDEGNAANPEMELKHNPYRKPSDAV